MMFYQVKEMPRYDTTDFRINAHELDPCLAAELRLKTTISRQWVVAFGLLTFFSLALFGLVFFFFGLPYFNSTSQYEGPLAAAGMTSLEPPPPSTSIYSESTSPPTSESTTQSTTESTTTTEFTTSRPPPTQRAWTRPKFTWIPPETTTTPTTTVGIRSSTFIYSKSTSPPLQEFTILTSPSTTPSTRLPSLSPIIRPGSQRYQTCADYRARGHAESGVYKLFLPQTGEFYARCVMSEDGESWIVMQSRTGDGTQFWNRTFAEYEAGFGDPAGDHWLGLSRVRALIDAGHLLRLRLQVETSLCRSEIGNLTVAGDYNFSIGPSTDGYRLNVSLIEQNFSNPRVFLAETGGTFTTADDPTSCAFTKRMGGFWFVNDRKSNCASIAPNGEFTCDRRSSDYGAFLHHYHYTNRGSFFNKLLKLRRISMLLRT